MSDVTRILSNIDQGDPAAAEQLLPLVYEELRKLASAKLAQERSGQTLQSTALVHEAYLRLVGSENGERWNSRGHFFGAAAEAMRRILVEAARRKQSLKHGGQLHRQDRNLDLLSASKPSEEVLAIDAAMEGLSRENPAVARVVELRYFAGFSLEEAATALDISDRTARRYWTYAKAWLRQAIADSR